MNGPLTGTWMVGTEIDGSVVAGINKPMSKGWTTLLAQDIKLQWYKSGGPHR